jgi:hypothetical protein
MNQFNIYYKIFLNLKLFMLSQTRKLIIASIYGYVIFNEYNTSNVSEEPAAFLSGVKSSSETSVVFLFLDTHGIVISVIDTCLMYGISHLLTNIESTTASRQMKHKMHFIAGVSEF